MTQLFLMRQISVFIVLLFLFISCGSDVVEEVIETYEFGNKKVFVRFHPDVNVLEKHFYNSAGEMVHLERDSLEKRSDFQDFLKGMWIINKMSVDGEVVFTKDSVFNPDNPPNLYNFAGKTLTVTGPQYIANYNIDYLDSCQIELDGKWTYGVKGEDNYRTKRIFNRNYFQFISYYKFIWIDFLKDPEKEEEVVFQRILLPIPEELSPNSIMP